MSQYIKTFEEQLPGGQRTARVPASDPGGRARGGGGADLGLISYPRKWPELTVIPWREEVMVLAVHPSHRFAGAGDRGYPRARRRGVRRLRRRAVDPPGHRPLPSPSRCERRGRARVRQHREHQAGRRDPGGRVDPSRAFPRPRGRAGHARRGADRRPGPEVPAEPAAGDHPPPQRQPRPDGLAVPGVADGSGVDAGPLSGTVAAPTRRQRAASSSRAGPEAA